MLSNELMRYPNPYLKANDTKYSSYQLPGGENYREHLLALPEPMKQYNQFTDALRAKYGQGDFNNLPLTQAERNHLDSLMEKAGDEGQPSYKSSHWDEPNVLAHIRTNERDVGGVPSLHLEEIQSDWHQQGRDKGYSGNNPLTKEEREEYHNLNVLPDKVRTIEQNARLKELTKKSMANRYGVPDAPFKTSWPELAMKRAIRTAVEDGKNRISWTPGEAQAARYELSKSVDKVHYNSDLKTVVAYKDGNQIISKSNVTPKDLPDVIGKEAADKIINSPTRKAGNTHELSGVDLKVGGEGMKGFYDQILPKMVEKLGKKYGVKVKQERINKPEFAVSPEKLEDGRMVYDVHVNGRLYSSFHTKEEAEAIASKAEKEKKGTPVYYFDIPEKMKQDVLTKGFPLFSSPLPVPNQRND